MKKYYIDDYPFAADSLEKYDLIIDSLMSDVCSIEVVQAILEDTDFESRKKINLLLREPATYFKSQQPFERSVSLSPFLVKENYNSVCFKYNLTDEIISELKTDWRKILAEELVLDSFIVYKNALPLLWYGYFGTVALLGENEINLWQSKGFNLTEFNVDLNAIYFSIFK